MAKRPRAYTILPLFTLAALLGGCVTPQVVETSIASKTGVRVSELRFDTALAREQYIVLGVASGDGQAERRLIGPVPKERSLFSWLVPKSYYAFEFDRFLGVWADEGRIGSTIVGDRLMDPSELETVRRMEVIAARGALYKALDSYPEADAILAPRYDFAYTTEDRTLGAKRVLSRSIVKVTAHVTGKAVRMKTEEELYRTYREFPGLASPKPGE